MFDYHKQFQASETTVLLRMLETPEKYQPDALQAARDLLDRRQATEPAAYEAAVSELKAAKLAQEQQLRASAAAAAAINNVHDIWREDEEMIAQRKRVRNYIYSIAFVYAVLALWTVVSKISVFNELMQVDADLISLRYIAVSLTPVLFSITALIFFLKREKTGWVLLTIDSTFRLVMSLGIMLVTLQYSDHQDEALSNLLPSVLFALVLYRLSNVKMRDLFRISPMLQWLTICITAFLTIIYMFALYNGMLS